MVLEWIFTVRNCTYIYIYHDLPTYLPAYFLGSFFWFSWQLMASIPSPWSWLAGIAQEQSRVINGDGSEPRFDLFHFEPLDWSIGDIHGGCRISCDSLGVHIWFNIYIIWYIIISIFTYNMIYIYLYQYLFNMKYNYINIHIWTIINIWCAYLCMVCIFILHCDKLC